MAPDSTPLSPLHWLIAAFGPDRPGIVDDLSGWVFAYGLNIEGSRMARLGDDFAVLMLVSGCAEAGAKLIADRNAFMASSNLTVSMRKTTVGALPAESASLECALTATALDHPGILHRVTRLLRENGISIADARTRTSPAPFTGTPIFELTIQMTVPAGVSSSRLREALRALGERENIDFLLSPMEW